MLDYIVISFIIILILVKLYIKLTTNICKNYTCLVGKTVIITGANTGIGYATALNLAMRGAKIILACRDEIKANQAKNQLISQTKNPNISVKLVDFKSLESIRKFAENINRDEDKLDILINNAGTIIANEKSRTDGFNEIMLVNYFSPVLLTILLLDKLKKSGPSRIINVSSMAARHSKLDPLNPNKYFDNNQVYCNSKLANIFFTKTLAKYLDGSGVSVHSLHPGIIMTNMPKSMVPTQIFNVASYFTKNMEEGAQTTIYLATDDVTQFNGEHFEECKRVNSYKLANNIEMEKLLWNTTLKLLEIDENFLSLRKN